VLVSASSRFKDTLPPETTTTLHSHLDDVVELLACLDKGNLTITRCRECIQRLLECLNTVGEDVFNEYTGSHGNRVDIAGLTPTSSMRETDVGLTGLQLGSGVNSTLAPPGGYDEALAYHVDPYFGPLGGLIVGSEFESLVGL
jgi:hypothetical protein